LLIRWREECQRAGAKAGIFYKRLVYGDAAEPGEVLATVHQKAQRHSLALCCNSTAVNPAVAFPAVFRRNSGMSDKQLALESIQRLPEDANLDTIAERLEFLAGIRKGLDQIERGETVSHEEVKRQLATWLTKQSGRFKRVMTSGKS
jgi:predicted transcriptional regulator